MSSAMERVTRALGDHGCRQTGGAWTCPAHADSTPSLSVTEAVDGRVLVKCHAGCATDDVVAALGLQLADLFEPRRPVPRRARSKIVATYDYEDQDGVRLFQVCRYEPKGFRQRRPDGSGGWIWSLDGTPRVLFRLPKVLAAAGSGATIYVVEGEKDALAIERAGGIATCNPGGAGKWRGEYSKALAGARCRVVADDDEPGRRHACAVASSLRSAGIDVELLLPAHGKDAHDHLGHGLGLDAFVPMPAEVAKNANDGAAKGVDSIQPGELHRSDAGNADLFARIHGDHVRYDFRRGRWLIWSGHHWAPDSDGRVMLMAEGVARARFEGAWHISDRDKARQEAAFAIVSENRNRLSAMLDLARSHPPIADAGENWDADPMLLGAPNGVVDLRTGTLREGTPADRISLQAAVPFDPKAPCDRWLQFVYEVFGGDEELIEFVWGAVGYSLTGDVSEQCLFLLHGTGANGKSTFLNALRHAVGDYGYNTPFATLEMDRRSSVPNDLAALVSRRLVTASETDEAIRLNEGRVKALTGGDPITARFLHHEFFSFRPVAKFWLAVNHKPRVTDDSHGFWRRVRLIPFTKQFPGDKTLEATLQAEAPGILRWAVEGCRLWQERGLDAPECVSTATEEYRRESDLLEEFLAECVEVTDESDELPVRALVEAYNEWAGREGLTQRERLGSRGLRSRLKGRWPDRHRAAVRSTPARYVGLGLRRADA